MAMDISDAHTQKRPSSFHEHNTTASNATANNNNNKTNDMTSLRRDAEQDKQRQLESLIQHHERLIRELYLLQPQQSPQQHDNDSDPVNDPFSRFLEMANDPIDQDKLTAFLDQHKLRLAKAESSSSSPPPSENVTPSNTSMTDNNESTKRNSTTPTTAQQQQRRVPPPPERMVTRGVSGAIRHKSVGEILSGLDQHNVEITARSTKEKRDSPPKQPRRAAQQQRALVSLGGRRGESKYYPPQTYNGVKLHDLFSEKEPRIDLFAWQLKAKAQPLHKVIKTARKAVTTHEWKLAMDQMKSIKTIQEIEDLKKKNLWSMKQLKRHKAVPRAKTHWDIMLDEMKWMRTDFRQERKWKVAMAYTLSHAVMEWHMVQDKSTVCVKVKTPPSLPPRLEHVDNDDVSPHTDDHHDHLFSGRAPSPDMSDIAADDTMMLDKQQQPQTQPLPTPPQQQSLEDEVVRVKTEEERSEPSATTTTTTTTEPEAAVVPTALSSAIMQTYRSAIRNLDPNVPVFTLAIEDIGPFNIHDLFPDLLTYEPPKPSDNDDPYFNELEYGRIVPISKLSTTRVSLQNRPRQLSRKRTIDGEQIPIMPATDADIKMPNPLPRSDRFDPTPLISPLFAPRKIRSDTNTSAAQQQQPRVPPPPTTPRITAVTWTDEDDICLIQMIMQFGFNWELVSDAFNSIRASKGGGSSSDKRSPWECHERWKTNNLTTVSGQVSPAHMAKLKKENSRNTKPPSKLDSTNNKRRQRQYNVFEAIKRSQKKREEAQRNAAATTAAPPPRNTVETHGMNAAGQRLPTAMELSMHKIQRDRQMAQMLLEQRHLSAAYGLGVQNLHGLPRPPPPPPPPVPQQPHPQGVPAGMSQQVPLPQSQQQQQQQQLQRASPVPVNVGVQQQQRPPQIPTPVAAAMPTPQQQQQQQQQQQAQLNRYPPAQLQLLRQQQMALAAVAQAQAQAQAAAAAAAQGRTATPTPTPTPTPPRPTPSSSSPNPESSPMNTRPQQATPTPLPQQQQQQQQAAANSPQAQAAAAAAAASNPLAVAARLMQMGYPMQQFAVQQLAPAQQLQLQRYIVQLQMRAQQQAQQQQQQQQQQQTAGSSASSAVPVPVAPAAPTTAAASSSPAAIVPTPPPAAPGIVPVGQQQPQGMPSPQQLAAAAAAMAVSAAGATTTTTTATATNGGNGNNSTHVSAAAILAAQQRFQQAAQVQQLLQMQHLQQQLQAVQQAQQQQQQQQQQQSTTTTTTAAAAAATSTPAVVTPTPDPNIKPSPQPPASSSSQ